MDAYRNLTIIKNRGNEYHEVVDPVALETKVRITVQGEELLSLSCTPVMVRELITGFLVTEKILPDIASATAVRIQYGDDIFAEIPAGLMETRTALCRSLGGLTAGSEEKARIKIQGGLSLSASSLKSLCRDFQNRSELFRLTGCFHSAAVSDGTKILAFAEDIGRHNAVDKVIGYTLLNNILLEGMIMLVSCRVSSDIITKCLRWNIPILASRAAPTALSIRIAEESGMTLAGFVRGDSMNLYTHSRRIRG
ncbi:MAG: formate dehydrogenase accessory sulfurtransferase FdhD [Nitrospirota bacterium]